MTKNISKGVHPVRNNSNSKGVHPVRSLASNGVKWANLLHIYQPPQQEERIIKKVVRESYSPVLDVLEARPSVKITLNICASLTEQLIKYGFKEIIERISKLANRGQIEFTGSAKYHPILPLLPEDEIKRQIELNNETNKKYFGNIWKPTGFFLPELAYSKKVARIIQELGYQWIVLDEIAFNGKLGEVVFDINYEMKNLSPIRDQKGLKIIFRNRGLSLLFFGTWLDSVDPVRSNSASNGVDKFFYAVKKDKRSNKFLVTAFDGENLGHHRKNLINVWRKILDNSNIESITYSEYLNNLQGKIIRKVNPIDSSWSTEVKDIENNIPYPLWNHPKNKLHQLQWKLTYLNLKLIGKYQGNKNYKEARNLLDKALASDQYWWASIKQWGGLGIIKRTIDQFLKIEELFRDSLSDKETRESQYIVNNIFKEIERREKSGDYKINNKIGNWK